MRAGDDAHRHRPAGLDGDTPEHQPPDPLDRAAHVVGLAGRDAAGGEHEIVVFGRAGDRAREPFGIVRQDAEIGRFATETFDQPRQQITIGVEQRRRGPRRAGLDDLVAGREHGDAHAAEHVQRGQPDRGGQRNILRNKPPARRQHDRTRAHVLACEPAVGAGLEPRRHDHRLGRRRARPPA